MSQRDRIRMTDDEVAAFLDGRHTMACATIGPTGHPHVVAMWYGFNDGRPALWTYARSQKVVNLRRDPRITCLVESGGEYHELRGVGLVGTADIVDDPDVVVDVGASIHERYQGQEATPEIRDALRERGAKRVAVLVDVEDVVSWDHRKLGT